MKKHLIQKILTYSFIVTSILQSCKKEQIKSRETEVNTTRLVFNSNKEFESLMGKLVKEKDDELGTTVKNYALNNNFKSFYEVQKAKTYPKISVLSTNEIDEEEEDPFDNLVPDPYFASVLDSNLEVSVENVIYKVTPFGTFIISPEKYERLLEILSNMIYSKELDFKNHVFYSKRIIDDFYKIEDGIIILDTYKRVEGSEYKVFNSKLQTLNTKPNAVKTFDTGIDEELYQNIPTIYFGAKTWAGKLFESLRGREEIYKDNFNSKRRVRVNFYNASWGVYSSIGASVKMQKKNWIGWSGTAAEELRLGWDGLEYYLGELPSNTGALPLPAYQKFTPVDLPKLTKQYVEVDLLGYPIKFDRNKQLQVGVKEIFDFARANVPSLYPKQANVNYAFKVWSDFTRRSISYVQERDEIIGYNVETLSKTFDWAVGAKITSDFTSINVGYAPLNFTLESASVFGLAKSGGEWKGARIISK